MTQPRRKAGRPVGETLGGILAGFDQQIMRNSPPPHELVHKGTPVRGLSGDDAGDLTITLAPPIDRTDQAAGNAAMIRPATATTDLLDADPDAYDVCESPLRRFGGATAFHGRIRTVRCHEDNVLLRGILETPGEGGVLVVDGGGSMHTALLGDMVAGLGVANDWAGIVINGCVRDVVALASMPIGIVALGSNPRRSGKTGAGEVDRPVTFGGATFVPGAILTCDEDGLIVTRAARTRVPRDG